MSEIIELVKVVGFPALIFYIWHLYHQAETTKWATMREDEDKKWGNLVGQLKTDQEAKFNLFRELLQQTERARGSQFQLLRETIETMNFHSSQLARIEQKVDTNQFCPVTRKEHTA